MDGGDVEAGVPLWRRSKQDARVINGELLDDFCGITRYGRFEEPPIHPSLLMLQ